MAKGGIRLRVVVVRALLLAIVIHLPWLVAEAIHYTQSEWWTSPAVEMVGCFVMGCALLVLLIAAAYLVSPRHRESAMSYVIGSALLISSFVPAAMAANALRMRAFALAAERAEPLVVAIEKYHREHGVPPNDFSDLVPRYLAAMPDGLPPLELVTGTDAKRIYHGNDWVLTASVPSGGINFDRFMFFPNSAYPERDYGGVIQRIGRWAYVHE